MIHNRHDQNGQPVGSQTLKPPERFSEEQSRVAGEIAAGPRGGVRLPFQLLLNSPKLAETLSSVGEYLRFNSSLPATVREAAILASAHEHRCRYEWEAHSKIAEAVGLSPTVIRRIQGDSDAVEDDSSENLAVSFCQSLMRTKVASAPLQGKVIAAFGSDGLIDLVGICGYYGTLAMVINLSTAPTNATEATAGR